jgi:hypothetical protein
MKSIFKGALSALTVVLALSGLTAFSALAAPSIASAEEVWSVQEFQGLLEPRMNAVSCLSGASCRAVGSYDNGNIPPQTQAVSGVWNGSTWSLGSVPLPVGAKGSSLKGVSCTASTACEAVGSFESSAGVTLPLAEKYSGSWSLQEPPAPTGAKSSILRGVSCISSSACTAAGSFVNASGVTVPLAESWNGTSWSVQQPPVPTGATKSSLEAISCVSSTSCRAAGSFVNASGVTEALAESWNGTSWSAQEPPAPTGASRAALESVSCPSSTVCIATGTFTNSAGKAVPLAESWNGTSWTAQEPPLPAEATAGKLSSVSCSSTTVCEAFGYANKKGQTLAERWNGTSWTTQEAPTLAEQPTWIAEYGVSCPTETECFATYGKAAERLQPPHVTSITPAEGTLDGGTAVVLKGSRFAAGATVTIGVAATAVEVVSETEIRAKTAADAEGKYEVVVNDKYGISTGGPKYTYTPPVWSVQEFQGLLEPRMNAVSCLSGTSCRAVGSYDNGNVPPQTQAATGVWNGSTWSLGSVPLPVGAKGSALKGLSCTSSTACEAVGSFENSSGVTVPLAEKYSGSWSLQEPPAPTGAKSSILRGVSCISSTSCEAAGSFVNASGVTVPLAESWNGTSWSVQQPPVPTGATQSSLEAISCVSSTSCKAAGSFVNASGVAEALIESWNGTSWSVQEPPAPSGSTRTVLTGVSCPSSTVCIATGNFTNSAGKAVPLGESWNGTSWSSQEPPLPTGATAGKLASVSCASTTVCEGFGYSNAKGEALAERWNGSSWSTQPVPTLPEQETWLGEYGISCPTQTECTATYGKAAERLR